LLPNSALLTVHGWGHTSLFLSSCVDEAVAAHPLAIAVPAPGTACEQDVVPFTAPASASWTNGRAELRARILAELMPDAVLRAIN